MNNIIFSPKAFDEYIEWQTEDKKTLKKINNLLTDIQRNKFIGIGKPEPLKGTLSGCWSRHIDEKNRIVYRINNENDIEIIQCKRHYDNK